MSPQEEKRDREKEIQKANKEILDKFSEHVKQFEVEKVTRLQRETQTLKRVGDEVFRIQQKIGSERMAAWPKWHPWAWPVSSPAPAQGAPDSLWRLRISPWGGRATGRAATA